MHINAYTLMGKVHWTARVSGESFEGNMWTHVKAGQYDTVDAPTNEDEVSYLCDQVQRSIERDRVRPTSS